MYFDTHAHLDDKAFDEDRENLLNTLKQTGVELVIDPGCDLTSSRKAKSIAEENDFIYFAAGFHPQELKTCNCDTLEKTLMLTQNYKCIAVGEIGLDYYWDDSRKQEQQNIFHAQLSFAQERDLPVIIHDREAHGDCLEIVKQYPKLRGVFHCYSGSLEIAEELLKRGWYLGFDGPVTTKTLEKFRVFSTAAPLREFFLKQTALIFLQYQCVGKEMIPGI